MGLDLRRGARSLPNAALPRNVGIWDVRFKAAYRLARPADLHPTPSYERVSVGGGAPPPLPLASGRGRWELNRGCSAPERQRPNH